MTVVWKAPDDIKTVNILLAGFGTVGREFVRVLHRRETEWEARYRLRFRLVGILGSGGLLYDADGLQLAALLDAPGRGSEALSDYADDERGRTATWLEASASATMAMPDWGQLADVLVEATPTNISHGEPALSYMLQALSRGLDVVAISKGALVSNLGAIRDAARASGTRLRYSGATAAALPTLDLGDYALAGCRISKIEGILNGTTNYILTRMHEEPVSFAEALQEAQQRGIAETNPALDVEGTDSACKLVLLANALLGASSTLRDVQVTGIDRVTPDAIAAAQQAGRKLKLLASAELVPSDASSDSATRVRLEVAPRELEPGHPLFGVDRTEKGIVFHTDLMGTVAAIGGASSPTGAAAAAWKDLINLYRPDK